MKSSEIFGYSDLSSSEGFNVYGCVCRSMFGESVWENDNHISDSAAEPETQTIEDIEEVNRNLTAATRFILSTS